MFDKPNSSAFHVIALFLFAKLDKSHAAEAFKDCSVPVGNPEFRKQCCIWLKDIANEDKSCFPEVTPSLFISPAGPKFIQLLYWFARHVLVKDMKTNSVGIDIPFAEAVVLRPKDIHMANARCRVAYNKLLQILQKEDFVIQEYEKKAQLLIKEIKQIKSEYAVLQIQSCKMKQNDQNKNDKTERIQKVRSMWTCIMEMLTSLKKEKEVVDSVLHELEDCDGQCILDGTNIVSSVPRLLAYRVESGIHQVCTGNLYEAEKLNFLTVIQLLNEALRTLRDERCQSELNQQFQVIEDKVTRCNKVLLDLKAKRLKIWQQHCVPTSASISRKQEEWKAKWRSFLRLCPFNLILDRHPELDLRASPPHSFNFAEGDEEDSVFCQHLLSVSEVCDSVHEVHYEKNDGASETMMDKSTPPPRCPLPPPPRISSVPLELSKASENRDVLIEKDLHTETIKGEKKPVPPKILKNGKDEYTISKMWEDAGDHVIQRESPVKKEDSLKKTRDELAEEVAKTVVSESPQSGEGKGMALEDLISSLAVNAFLTRKQIPRTPENLLTEIRSSWRKAIEIDGSSDIEVAPAEVMREEAPMDAGPIVQKAADSRFVCSTPASPVPDFDPPWSEMESQSSSTEFRCQEQMRVSHIIEPPVLETSGMRESERTEEQELKCIVLNKSSVQDPEEPTFQYVKKSMNTTSTCSENSSRTDVLPSDHFQGSLMDGMLHWDVSSLVSSIRREAAFLRILDESFPEELDNIDPNKSENSESDFDVIDSTYVTGGSKNKGDIQKSKLDIQPLFNTYKALKKTASRNEEEVHQTPNGGESGSCRSDLSLAPEKGEGDEFCGPLEPFCLDEEFIKMTSPVSLGDERKYSLSSLLISCQHLEEMASMVHEIPLDLIHKLKDKEQLNEKLGTKEPSSG
ncbi:PREDICTED: HAUS augmin-like complex subunit 6 [Fulmarus glacialis]|uniref:HAUS augmin-like complex subunit 6 n=1 Tax=Fulmarus glacialis TaxID=30455 RepID=UPI00051C2BD0|nr:PREDICTED: HAUS augmin-like complex subunit 6 [Fulmarus glacialis]